MTDDSKHTPFPSADDPDRQAAAERYVDLVTGAGTGDIWREIAGTERDREPTARYVHVAERLIKDDRVRGRVIAAMKEIRSRCVERDGGHRYAFTRRQEIQDPSRGLGPYAGKIRDLLRAFAGQINADSFRGLLPKASWMTDDQWKWAFSSYVYVMTGQDDRIRRRRLPLSLIFDAIPNPDMAQFSMPARGVLTGHLVHGPLMGDLAELLAVAGGLAAAEDPKAEVVCDYLRFAARTPPLVVAAENGFHLTHLCAD